MKRIHFRSFRVINQHEYKNGHQKISRFKSSIKKRETYEDKMNPNVTLNYIKFADSIENLCETSERFIEILAEEQIARNGCCSSGILQMRTSFIKSRWQTESIDVCNPNEQEDQ